MRHQICSANDQRFYSQLNITVKDLVTQSKRQKRLFHKAHLINLLELSVSISLSLCLYITQVCIKLEFHCILHSGSQHSLV